MSETVVDTLRDGNIVLYTRSETKKPLINYRIRLPGDAQRYERKSTGVTDLSSARRMAEDRYEQLMHRTRQGLCPVAPMFAVLAEQYVEHIDRRVADGTLSKMRGHIHKTIIHHYIIPFFDGMRADEVTKSVVEKYHDWRRDIYAGKAAYPAHVRKSTNLNRKYTANAETQNNTIINLIFARAVNNDLIAPSEALKLARAGKGGKRRGYFSDAQIGEIFEHMKARIDRADAHIYRRHYAVLFYHYVNILLHTGMRVGEMRSLRWCDIVPFHKGGVEYCELRVTGKTGKRTMVALPEAVASLNELRAFYEQTRGVVDPSAPCVIAYNGTPIGSFHLQFARILHTLGIKQDEQGQERSIYSLRHTYITKRLLAGVSIHLLARNCGTSVRQIEKNYDHVIPRMRVEELLQVAQ